MLSLFVSNTYVTTVLMTFTCTEKSIDACSNLQAEHTGKPDAEVTSIETLFQGQFMVTRKMSTTLKIHQAKQKIPWVWRTLLKNHAFLFRELDRNRDKWKRDALTDCVSAVEEVRDFSTSDVVQWPDGVAVPKVAADVKDQIARTGHHQVVLACE